MNKLKIKLDDLIGKPFKWCARGPNFFDCYGLVMEVSKRLNNPLPDYKSFINKELRSLYIENKKSDFIKVEEPEAGVIVTFKLHPKYVSHIGIMISDYEFIHIMRKKRVAVERIDHPFWKKKIDGFFVYSRENNE